MRSDQIPSKCQPTLVQPEAPDERLLVQRIRGRVNLLCKGYANPPARAFWLGPDGQPIHHDTNLDSIYPPLSYPLTPFHSGSSNQANHESSTNTHHSYPHPATSASASTIHHHGAENWLTSIGAHAWLRLTHLSPSHEGTYTCVLNSTLGSVQRKVRLLVERVRMRLQVEQLGASHVTVSWQLISELHGRNSSDARSEANLHRLDSRPLQYEVLYRPDDQLMLQPQSSVRSNGRESSDSNGMDSTNNEPVTLPRNWGGFEVVAISPHLHSFTVAGLRSLKRYMLCVGVREQPVTSWEPSLNDQPATDPASQSNWPDTQSINDQSNEYDHVEPIQAHSNNRHHRSHRYLSYVSELPVEEDISFATGSSSSERSRRASSTSNGATASVPAVYLSVACVRVSTSQPILAGGASFSVPSSAATTIVGRDHVRHLLPVAVDQYSDEIKRDDFMQQQQAHRHLHHAHNHHNSHHSFTNEISRISSDWWAKVVGNEKLSQLAARLDRLLSRLVKLTAMISAGTLLLLIVIGVAWSVRIRRQRAAFETPRKTLLMHMQHQPHTSNTQPSTPNHTARPITPQIPMESIYTSNLAGPPRSSSTS